MLSFKKISFVFITDALDTNKLLFFRYFNERNTLGVTPKHGDLIDTGSDKRATITDEHYFIACELDENDWLVGVAITDGQQDILMLSDAGKAVRFKESDVRAMGRTARGVRGIKLAEDQRVISLIVPEENGTILTASQRGFGKRTNVEEFPTKGRGTQGVIAMVTSERNGALVGAVQVFDGDEVMLVSDRALANADSASSSKTASSVKVTGSSPAP